MIHLCLDKFQIRNWSSLSISYYDEIPDSDWCCRCRLFTNILVRSVWLGTNATLELFLFLRKFVANSLRWDNSFFSHVGMLRMSLNNLIIDKFVNEWKRINWFNKVNKGTMLKWTFGRLFCGTHYTLHRIYV